MSPSSFWSIRRYAFPILVILGLLFLAGFVFFVFPSLYITSHDLPKSADRLKAQNDVRVAAIQALGGLVALVGVLLAARQFTLQRYSELEKRVDNRIEQLGSPNLETRMAGINGLGRVALESRADAQWIRAALSAWVRTTARPDPAATHQGPRPDVAAALNVLGRFRLIAVDRRGLDLTGADLHAVDLRASSLAGADLSGAQLALADLSSSDLTHARLVQSDLYRANLLGARLDRADLLGANLDEALLDAALLSEARLLDASIRRASLRGVDLTKAVLESADCQGADFTGARLAGATLARADLRDTILTGASYDTRTVWPADFDPEAAGAEAIVSAE